MLGETGGARATHVVLHSEPAERDSAEALGRGQFLHQLVPGPIRQADIADYQVELLLPRLFHGLIRRVCHRHPVTAPFEHHLHAPEGIAVIVAPPNARGPVPFACAPFAAASFGPRALGTGGTTAGAATVVSVTMKVAPRFFPLLSALMIPPCALTMAFEMAR